MNKADLFTTIQLSSGDSCEIYQIKPIHVWKASFKQNTLKEHEVNHVPFLIEQVITINKKKVNWESIGNMEYFDYMKIEEVITRMMTPLF